MLVVGALERGEVVAAEGFGGSVGKVGAKSMMAVVVEASRNWDGVAEVKFRKVDSGWLGDDGSAELWGLAGEVRG